MVFWNSFFPWGLIVSWKSVYELRTCFWKLIPKQRAFFPEGCPNLSHTSANLAFLLISEELAEQKWNYARANGSHSANSPLSQRVSGVQSWAGTKIH